MGFFYFNNFSQIKLFFPKIFNLKPISWLLMIISIITIVAGITYIYFSKQRLNLKNSSTTQLNTPTVLAAQDQIDTTASVVDLKTLNILLLGYGGAGHQGGYLTDVMQILHLDFEKSQLSLISIPRDLWVKLPNGNETKINSAFTLGENPKQPVSSGGQVAKQMVEAVTGLSINYFIAIDFNGFERVIGQELNSIRVEIPDTLDDPWYPIKGEELNPCGMTPAEITELSHKYSGFELEKQFKCRYEHLHFEKGIITMEGGDALKYVRSRHGSSSGDFSRSQRQQAILKAIGQKLISKQALSSSTEWFEKLQQHVVTDLDLEIIKYLMPALNNIADFSIKNIVLSTDNVFKSSKTIQGQSIIVPRENWQKVHNFILKLLTL